MRKNFKNLVTIIIVLGVISLGCTPANSPEGVVIRMVKAQISGDSEKYLETILPAQRVFPTLNLISILDSLSVKLSVVSVDLGQLTKIEIKDIKADTIVQLDDYALVQIRGKVQYDILNMEVPYCDEYDVVKEDNKWYVSPYDERRIQRINELVPIREAEINQLDDITALGRSLELILDMCTHPHD